MNMHKDITPAPLVYNGEIIRERETMLSLTDMWKAAGSPTNREPFNWARFEGRAFIEAVALAQNLSEKQVFVSKSGRGGGTFAHWQIGLAYAKYLSPEFHMWCNEVVRERMEGRSIAVANLPPEVLEMIRRDDGISRMLAHKVTGLETSLQALASAVSAIAQVVQPPASGIYVTGKTSGEIWRAAGFPRIRVTCWFSNRLVKMGCQVEGNRRVPVGLGRAKLFDPDKAETWLRNGGRILVEEYIAQRMGQGKLRLVEGNHNA